MDIAGEEALPEMEEIEDDDEVVWEAEDEAADSEASGDTN